MWEIAAVALFGLPAAVVALILLDLFKDGVDEAATRLSLRPDVARRLRAYAGLRRAGVVVCALAVLPIAAGIKGSASAHQWQRVLVLSGVMFTFGSALLLLWWLLAGRRAKVESAQG